MGGLKFIELSTRACVVVQFSHDFIAIYNCDYGTERVFLKVTGFEASHYIVSDDGRVSNAL